MYRTVVLFSNSFGLFFFFFVIPNFTRFFPFLLPLRNSKRTRTVDCQTEELFLIELIPSAIEKKEKPKIDTFFFRLEFDIKL